MGSLSYILKKTFKNKIKKAMKRPTTYFFFAFIMAYLILILITFRTLATKIGIDNPEGMAAALTIMVILIIPSNVISFVKRKGLLFTPSDVHMIFQSPSNPKKILLYAYSRNIIVSFILGVITVLGGYIWCHISPILMLLYFLFVFVMEGVLETSMMIILYGNEFMNESMKKIIEVAMYFLMGMFVIIGFIIIWREGFTAASILGYLHSPYIQLIPIAGWNIAVIHLIFMGPTMVNVIGSVLLAIATLLLFLVAKNMKCTGDFYEDAMKFADDFAEVRKKAKKGEVSRIGSKRKYKSSQIIYKGNFAKAIFYRQLLEYKKNRFFIFGVNTLFCFAISITLIIALRGEKLPIGKEFIIPGVMAYYIFITSGYMTKWKKELKNPYTYLLPDRALKKLWYATLMEHIRAVIDGILLAVPVGIFIKIAPLQILLSIALYVCLQACKLYIIVLGEGIFGSTLGEFPKQILKLFLLGIVVSIGALPAVLGVVFINIEAGFLGMIAVVVLLSLGIMWISSRVFSRMESVDN